MTVVGLSCHLSMVSFFFTSLLLNMALTPFHLSTIHFYSFSLLTNIPSFTSFLQILSFLTLFTFLACCLTLSRLSHQHLPLFLTLLSPLLPQDPKERLGCHPQTGFADIMGHPFFRNVDWDLVSHSLLFSPLSFVSAFLALFFNFITTFIIIRNERNQYVPVKINPYIDSAEKEKPKASTRQQKVKSKCIGSASLSCPAGLAALSEQRVISDIMSLWEAGRLTTAEMARKRWNGN